MLRSTVATFVILVWAVLCSEDGSKPFSQNYERELLAIKNLLNRIEEFTLDNGAKVAILRFEHAPTFAYVVGVKAGSVDEPPNQKGIAHFLEHLAFKGTRTIGTRDFAREEPLLRRLWELEKRLVQNKLSGHEKEEMKKIRAQLRELWITEDLQARLADLGGVDINASTSADFTKYYGRYPSESFIPVMNIEIDRLLNIVPRQFHEERRVILQERSMRVENDPLGRMYERFIKLAFAGEPYQYPVIGYSEDLLRLVPDDLIKFHDEHYVGGNIVISIVGLVKDDEVEHLKKLFSTFPKKSQKREERRPKKRFRDAMEIYDQFGTRAIFMGFKKDVYPADEDICASLASRALFDSKFGLLTKQVVERDRIVSSVSSSEVPGIRYPNVVLVYLPLIQNVDARSGVRLLKNRLKEAVNQLDDENVVNKVKGMVISDVARVLENRMSLADWISDSLLLYGSAKPVVDLIEKMLYLTPQDLKRCAEDIFSHTNSIVLVSEK